MIHSRNGQKYAQFDFDDFSERGLRDFLRDMKKAGAEVTGVSATNRKRRVNGLPQKMAVLHMINGQSVTIRIGETGDLVETKLNSQKIPIKRKDSFTNIAREISDAARRNQAKFDKAQARKLAKLKVDTGPAAKKSTGKSVKELADRLESLQTETTQLIERRDGLNTDISELRSKIEATKSEITTLSAVETQLLDELEALESDNE